MRRHFLTAIAVSGSLFALTACQDADAIEGSNTNEPVTTVSTEIVVNVPPGYDKASMFGVPREARILLLASP